MPQGINYPRLIAHQVILIILQIHISERTGVGLAVHANRDRTAIDQRRSIYEYRCCDTRETTDRHRRTAGHEQGGAVAGTAETDQARSFFTGMSERHRA